MRKQMAPALPYTKGEKVQLFTGHFFFILLIIVCIISYRERLLAFDTAYYTFHLLTYKDFFIKHGRFISYLTQWVPLTFMDLGASLKTTLQSFSASFYIWFYLIFILIAHGLRNVAGGTLLVGTLCLGMRHKFYAAISEITFAMVISALLIAWLSRGQDKYKLSPQDMVVAGLCLLGLFGSHAVLIYPILSFLLFDRLYHRTYAQYKAWIMPAIITGVFILKFVAVRGDAYESNKMDILFSWQRILDVLSNWDKYYVYTALWEYFTQEYLLVLLLFGASLIYLWQQGHRLPAIFSLLSFVGWIVLNILIYHYLRSRILIMLDGYLAVLGLIWGIPFYYILQEKRQYLWPSLVSLGLISFSTYRMIDTGRFYRQRHLYIQDTLEMHRGEDKLIVPAAQFDWEKMWYPYEVAHESLMLTALAGRDSCRTIYVNINTPADAEYLSSKGFLQFDNVTPIEQINQSQFFRLPRAPYVRTDTVAW